ncbi:imidazoleglycerol-phosphate dehydratase HisB [soil metagenome]|nr:imidazoleglycerol-phosphate dehydratase HisB [Trueperaceae bacterium]
MRQAEIRRATSETDVRISLDLDAGPTGVVRTGHAFVDHLLDQVVRHGRFGLTVEATGDLHVDVHHLAEDVGITLGQTLLAALGDARGIERYASASVPMDETLVEVVLDLSGRPYLAFDPEGVPGVVSGFTAYHLRELLRGFCNHSRATVHVRILAMGEAHHVCEATVKALARALHAATRITGSDVPSTKGTL